MPRFSVVCLALCLLIVETRGPSSSIVPQPGSSTCSSLVQGSYTTRMAESVHEEGDTEADESLRLKKGRMRPLAPLNNAAKALNAGAGDRTPPKAAAGPSAAGHQVTRHVEAAKRAHLAESSIHLSGAASPATAATPVATHPEISRHAEVPAPAETPGATPAAPQSGAQERFPQVLTRLRYLPDMIASSVRRVQLSDLGGRLLSLNGVSTSVLVLLVLCFVAGVICCMGLAMLGVWKEPRKDGESPIAATRHYMRQESKGMSRPRMDLLAPPSAQQSSGFPMPGPVVSANPHIAVRMAPTAETVWRSRRSSEVEPGPQAQMPLNPNFGGLAGSGGEATGPHLCPELVVPEGSECTLMVPRLPLPASLNSGQVSVDDARGVPVFQASFGPGRTWSSAGKQEKRLTLTSATGDAVFAFCRDRDGESGLSGLVIHHHSDALFGVLEELQDGYMVSTRKNWKISFRGDIQEGTVNAIDEDGRLLAVAEPAGPRRSVRIGPLVDAGLVALAILGIDTLEYLNPRKRSKSRLPSVI